MSKYLCFLRGTMLSLSSLVAVALAMSTQSQVLGREAARLDGFTQSDGTNFFALELKPSVPATAGPREVVILVSTAASQTGDYRTKSLETLKAALKRLSPQDRVKLVAFDLDAVPLTQGFLAPGSPEMEKAIGALEQRAPLGSCDVEKALDATVKSFTGDSKASRAAIFIGDGSSRANPITPEQLDRLVANLNVEHIPVTTFGVGPRIDGQLLGTIAVRSGGNAMHDSEKVDADTIGSSLADAAHGTVVWPKADAATWPAGMDVYPKTLPPLRSDRDTVLVGSTKSPLPKQLDIDAGGQKLSWDVPDMKSAPANSYLVSLVDQAKVDGGKTLPLVDSDSLINAKKEIEAGGQGLNRLAEEALNGGQFDKAGQLADEALRRNPNDIRAKRVKDAVATKAGGAVTIALPAAGKAGATPPVPAGPVPPAPAPVAGQPGDLNLQGDPGAPPPEGQAVQNDVNTNVAMVQQLQKNVDITINKARNQVGTNPDLAAQTIGDQINTVSAATEPTPEEKDVMLRRLEAVRTDIGQPQARVRAPPSTVARGQCRPARA